MAFVLTEPIVYGVRRGTIAGHETTGNIVLTAPARGPGSTAVGEADLLAGNALGGGNTVTASGGGVHTSGYAIGDALRMTGHAQAGHNTVSAFASGKAIAFGDALTLEGYAQGGHNIVTARGNSVSVYGDALLMTGHAQGGHNTVSGYSALATPSLYGAAETLSGYASAGHNTIRALGTSVMYGDAYELSGHAVGGGNLLIGPDDPHRVFGPPVANVMYGDGYKLLGHASGGGNTLVSGRNSDDVMWGDAAIVTTTAHRSANTFVFAPDNGHDTVMDFRPGVDHIELRGFDFADFDALARAFQLTDTGLDIVFGAEHSILLAGVSQVGAGDFLFG